MATGKREEDPYQGCNFLVEIDSLTVAGFSEVSGLQVETETEDYHEGGVNDYVHRLPKATKQSNITLKRGITDSDILWQWHQKAVNGRIERKKGRIVLLDSEGSEKWHWTFEGAYPVKWTGPELKADASSVALEILELAHTGITKG